MLKRLCFLLLATPLLAAVLTLPQVTATTSYAAIATASGSSTGYPTYSWATLQSSTVNSGGSCAGALVLVSVPGPTGTTGQPAAELEPGGTITIVNPGGPEPPLYSIQVKSSAGSGCLVNVAYGTANQ